jgi:hypothetical protein
MATTCYTEKKAAFEDDKTAKESLEDELEHEYIAMKKIQCYLRVWLETEDVTDIDKTITQKCDAKDIVTESVELVYPAIPDPYVIDTNPVSIHPGAVGFETQYYTEPTLTYHDVTPCAPTATATQAVCASTSKVWSTQGSNWLVYTTREMAAGYTTIGGSAAFTSQWNSLIEEAAMTIQFMFRNPSGSWNCGTNIISSYCEEGNFNTNKFSSSPRRRSFHIKCPDVDTSWNQMTVTFVRKSGGDIDINYFVNGELKGNDDGRGIRTAENFAIDGQICFGGGHLDRTEQTVEISKISIWNKELSASMMVDRCLANTEGLIAYYPLDGDFEDELGGRSLDPGWKNGEAARDLVGGFITAPGEDFPVCPC